MISKIKVFFLLSFALYASDLSIVSITPDQNLNVGQRVDLEVVATSATSYQWYKDGNIIPSATNAIYNTPILSISNNASQYHVVVSDGTLSLTSKTIVLNVGAATSQLLTLSGNLKNYEGQLYDEQALDMVVRLFTASENGLKVYEEAFMVAANKGVEVEKGQFVIRLGDGVSSNNLIQVIGQYKNLFAEFAVGSNLEPLLPRVPLTALPYAISSQPRTVFGEGQPTELAEIGSYYVNKQNGKTWVRTQSSWVLLNP